MPTRPFPLAIEVFATRHGRPRRLVIDAEDLEIFNKYKWSLNNSGYPYSSRGSLQDYLMGKPQEGYEWDHENKDKRDYRKSNLRQVTRTRNNFNMPTRCDNTSGRKGVTWAKRFNKWQAQLQLKGRNIFLGRFDNFEDAIKAREEGERNHAY